MKKTNSNEEKNGIGQLRRELFVNGTKLLEVLDELGKHEQTKDSYLKRLHQLKAERDSIFKKIDFINQQDEKF